jgi:hypothetical protein
MFCNEARKNCAKPTHLSRASAHGPAARGWCAPIEPQGSNPVPRFDLPPSFKV